MCNFQVVSVTNPVRGLPSNCHQRSLFHYFDSHTTQTVSHYLGLHFPCAISLIIRSPVTNYTHYITPTQIAEYCLVFIALLHSYITEPYRVFLSLVCPVYFLFTRVLILAWFTSSSLFSACLSWTLTCLGLLLRLAPLGYC